MFDHSHHFPLHTHQYLSQSKICLLSTFFRYGMSLCIESVSVLIMCYHCRYVHQNPVSIPHCIRNGMNHQCHGRLGHRCQCPWRTHQYLKGEKCKCVTLVIYLLVLGSYLCKHVCHLPGHSQCCRNKCKSQLYSCRSAHSCELQQCIH